jgi:hypothetical protein
VGTVVGPVVTFGAIVVGTVVEAATQSLLKFAITEATVVDTTDFGVVLGVIVVFGASGGFIGLRGLFIMSALFFVRAAALSEESPDPLQETKAIATTARREHF